MVVRYYEEVLFRLFVQNVIDVRVGPGLLCLAAMLLRICYIGLCMTPRHAQIIERRTKILLAHYMRLSTSGYNLFNNQVARAFKEVEDDESPEALCIPSPNSGKKTTKEDEEEKAKKAEMAKAGGKNKGGGRGRGRGRSHQAKTAK